LQAGDYSYQAVYSGDSNYNGSTGACEPFSVAQGPTTSATTVFDAATNAMWTNTEATGASAYDTASVTGQVGSIVPTGTVSYTFFTNATCSGNGSDAGTVTLKPDGSVPNSNTVGPLAAGNYGFRATYSGDANYTGSTGTCEPFSLGLTSTSTTTTVFDATTNAPWSSTETTGATAYDTASVSGQQGLIVPTGTVSYTLFPNDSCQGTGTDAGTVTLNPDGSVPNSNTTAPLAAGSYSYQAVYSGDSNYATSTGHCEPFNVNQAGSSTATVVKDHAGNTVDTTHPAPFGSKVHDTATVTATPLTPTGTVTYQLYTGLTCKAGNEMGSAETVTLDSSGNVPDSTETAALNAGDYSYQAVYSGDSNYTGSTGDCEPFSISKATPSIETTQDPASGSVGDTYKDKATLSGGGNPTGTITFDLYNNNSCSGTPVFEEKANVTNGNGTYETPNGVVLNTAGNYYWVATYNGDSNNVSVKSGCGDEKVVVNEAAIRIVKTADKAQVNAGDQIGFTLTVFNPGLGDAHGVQLSDTLPTNAGLSWSIASSGAGWGNPSSCKISSGVLTCGPATVPAGTTQAASTFTVHIVSGTDKTTGGSCQQGSGVVNNTGKVTTTNDGNDQSSASVCVAAPAIHIVKTADNAQVNAGDPIGFTLTVYNDGIGDAHGVTLSDTLPVKAGLSWSIASSGAGWGNPSSCKISSGVLTCGPVTVPAGTTQAASTFTVHITSPTTAATGGVCPGGSGVIHNTGSVTTTNDGSGQSTASTCVAAPAVSITKTADHSAPVNAGDQIGFTVEVKNTGSGAATGVKLVDPLPAGSGSGVTWSIDSTVGNPGQFVLSGAKGSQTLSLDSTTLPAGADYKVHIVASTSETECGTYDNTATLTTGNGNNPNPVSASESCAFRVDLSITKSGSPDNQELTPNATITWTMVVTNNGPDDDTGVTVSDPMPSGNTFVSAQTTKGSCTGGAILHCTIGPMAAGEKVTITLVTAPSQIGAQTNTVVVSGDRPEANLANNTATAQVQVGPFTPPCVAVSRITPGHLIVGRKTTLTIYLTQARKAVKGVRVRIKGPKVNIRTKPSNSKGIIKRTLTMHKKGILTITPLASSQGQGCSGKRIGVRGIFTPPVTG
jgi:uncharacterized repeat protein (TIGR01451 family)